MSGITITPAALHAALTQAHVALAEHRPDFAGAVIATLRTLTAPIHSGVFIVRDPAPEEAQPAHHHPLPAGPAEALPPGPDTPAADGAAAHPPPAPAPSPRNPGRPGTTWTAERVAMLLADYAACTDRSALLARLNAMPGEPIATVKAMQVKAGVLGIRTGGTALRIIAEQSGAKGGQASVAAHPPVAPTMRTPERLAALPSLWNDAALPVRAIMDRLNTLPGTTIVNTQTLYKWAGMLGLPTMRPAPVPEGAAPAPVDDKADAFADFAAGKTVRAVAEDTGLPLSTLSNWHAEWKVWARTAA